MGTDSKSTGELTYKGVLGLIDFPGEIYSVGLSDREGELQRSPDTKENKHNMENYWKLFCPLFHGWDSSQESFFAGVKYSHATENRENNTERRISKRRNRWEYERKSKMKNKGSCRKWNGKVRSRGKRSDGLQLCNGIKMEGKRNLWSLQLKQTHKLIFFIWDWNDCLGLVFYWMLLWNQISFVLFSLLFWLLKKIFGIFK